MLLHPTLLFLPSSYLSSPPPKTQSQTKLSQVMEKRMEDVFQRQTCVVSEETWSLGLVGDDMFVNEFLDLGGIPEVDSVEQPTFNEVCGPHETKHADPDTKSSTSTNSSAVSFDDIHPLIPAGDILDLEWVSKIVDDSQDHVRYSSHHIPTPLIITTNNHSRTLSSSSVTSARTPTKRPLVCLESLLFPGKPRTKRTRTPSHAWTPHHPLLHSRRGRGRPPKKAEKKRKNPESDSGSGNPNPNLNGRRCSHCGVQKTPQWRAGPMGAKTLCNACGVRYKSGRLLPEYRPAISPTFLDHVHSNSHRKVLEMRRKKESLHRLESESLLTEPVRFT